MSVVGSRGFSDLGPIEKKNFTGWTRKGDTHYLSVPLIVDPRLLRDLLSLLASKRVLGYGRTL